MSRLLTSPLSFAVTGGVFLAACIFGAVACSTPSGGPGGAAGANAGSRGEKFFLTKCNACHPGGGQGAGPPIDVGMAPSFLERGKTSGRHGVPEAEFDPLIAYLNQKLGGAPAAPNAVATAPATAPVATTPVATTPVATAPVAAATSGDPARGERYFQAKCNRCHPNGGAGVGPTTIGKPMPGPLKGTTTGGRHDVPPDEFDSLVAFLVSKGSVGGAVATAPVATAPVTAPVATAPAVAAAGDPAQGGAFYQAKCNKCHPGGNKGIGPALAGKNIPGVLQSGGAGKHGVDPASFENLLSYLTTLGAVRAGGPTATAPAATPVGTTPVATPPANTGNTSSIPNGAGMVPYACNCQCPAGTPPAALPAACICQCAPR